MAWFRGRDDEGPPAVPADDGDSPEELMLRHWEVVRFINAQAGRLPVESVVLARGITDTVRLVIAGADDRALDISVVVAVDGIIGDYLPTTLRSFLAVDPSLTDQPGPSGRTPRTALFEQLDALADGADDLLEASRSRDVDAMFTQGNFLRTKFTGSDLDL